MEFIVRTATQSFNCTQYIRLFAINFGFSSYEASLLSNAVSEASTNAIRYAKGATIFLSYTKNYMGLEIHIKDNGKGIENLEQCMEDGYSTYPNSLGLGFSSMKRSVDEMLIEKNDIEGLKLILRKYINKPPYDISEICIKKDGEYFNGDGCIVKHYDGDKTFIAVIDGAGFGFQANKSMQLVKDFILENYRLNFDEIVYGADKILRKNLLSRSVEIALLRIESQKIQYLILGNPFIKSFPNQSFLRYEGSLGLNVKKNLNILEHYFDDAFCIVVASDGIENNFDLSSSYSENKAVEVATTIFNNYNLDDDSSVVVIKKV